MTEQCKRYNRRFRFFFFSFVNFLCSRRIYGSTNLCFCRCLTMFIPSFGTAWKHWACVAVFFFFFVWCHHFCVSGFTLTVKEYPTRRNFVKYFIFTPSHVVTWIFFRQVSRFVFQDSGCELSSVHSISYVRFPSLSPSEYEYVFAHFVACLSLFSSLFEKWADHVLQSHSRRKERGKKKDTTKRMDLQRQAKDKRGACHIVIYLQISS